MKAEEGFVVVPLEGRGMGCLATRCPFGDIDISLFIRFFASSLLRVFFFVNSVISICDSFRDLGCLAIRSLIGDSNPIPYCAVQGH